jgi:hypothetical protein
VADVWQSLSPAAQEVIIGLYGRRDELHPVLHDAVFRRKKAYQIYACAVVLSRIVWHLTIPIVEVLGMANAPDQ